MAMIRYRAMIDITSDNKTIRENDTVRLLAMTSELVTLLKNTGEIVNVPMVVFDESFERCM